MPPRRKLSEYAKEMLHYLHRKEHQPINKIIRMDLPCLRGFSTSTIYKHATGKFADARASSGKPVGPPRKLQVRDERNISRAVRTLRQQYGASFTTTQLQEHTGLSHLNPSTVRKAMHRLGYRYLCTRKKGLMSATDMKRRVQWARKMRRRFNGADRKEQWRQAISMHIDIVGFEYKVVDYIIPGPSSIFCAVSLGTFIVSVKNKIRPILKTFLK